MARSTPRVQPLIGSSGISGWIIGAISASKFVVAINEEFQLWEVSATGVTMLDSVTAVGVEQSFRFTSTNGVVAVAQGVVGDGTAYSFFRDGDPWDYNVDVGISYYAEAAYVSGDQSELVVAQASDFAGVGGLYAAGFPMDGTTDPNWTCHPGLAYGRLIGAPRSERFLTMVGDDTPGGMTVHLMDSTGTSLDSVTFTHPPDSWFSSIGGVQNEADSLLWWVQVAENVNTYLGCTRVGGPTYAVTLIHHRTLITTGDTIAWDGPEQTFDPGWASISALDLLHPVGVSWDGQIAIAAYTDQFA